MKVSVPWRLVADKLSGGLLTVADLFRGFLFGKWAGTVFLCLWVFTMVQMWGERVAHKREIKEAVAAASAKATADAEKRITKATTSESERRDVVIKREFRRSQADVDLIAKQNKHIAGLQKEFQRASALNRGVPCLPAPAVVRLEAPFKR